MDSIYWDDYAQEKATYQMRLDTSHFVSMEFILKKHKIGGSKRILDAGCGDGVYTPFLANFGKVFAADVSFVQANRLMKRGYPALQCDLHNSPFKEGTFSLIFCNQVIEHVDDPAGFMASLYGTLEKGGILVVSTPNRLAPTRFLYLNFWHMVDKTHKREYTLKTARELAEQLSRLKDSKVELHGHSSIGRGRIKYFWWKLIPKKLKDRLLYLIYRRPIFAAGFVFLLKKNN